jgi:DHA1 family multidrug resistance protein-like MFS transporter
MKLNQSFDLRKVFQVEWQRTLIIVFIAQVVTAIGFSSIFPFLPLYVESLGSSTNLSIEFLAGLVFSAQALTMMIASPFWGALADRVGRKPMVERAMFGGAAIILIMAFVQNAEQLVALRTLQGAITGVVAASNALVASTTPRDRTGFAMGLLLVSMGTGVALGPLIGGSIADALGYSAAFFITAALLFIAGILVHFGIEEKFVPPDLGEEKSFRFFKGWREIFSTTGVPRTYGLSFLYMLGRMMVVPIAPLFIASLMEEDALLNTFTGLVIGASAATITISAAILGRLGDKTGHRRIVGVSAALAALLYFAQSFVNAPWQMLVLQALVGVFLGGITPAISALLARYTRQGEEGAVYGLNNSIQSAGRMLAPLLGASVAAWFDLRAAFIATAIVFVLIAILSRYLPQPDTSQKPIHRTSEPGGAHAG